MEWLVIIGLVVAVAVLWNRVGQLERRLHWLEPGEPLTQPAPSDAPEIARPAWAASAEPGTATEGNPSIPEVPPIVPSWEPAPPAASIPLEAEDPIERDDASTRLGNFLSHPPRFDFEDMFGRRLPIWAGGVALAVAGVFLVRFSIEALVVQLRSRGSLHE